MKKVVVLFLIILLMLSFVSCDNAEIEVGSKDGVVYFDYTNMTPNITVNKDDEKLLVEDPAFFEKLVNYIDGKPEQQTPIYYSDYIYLVEIGKYDFALHEEHIFIYSPLGHNVKGVKIIVVECTKKEIAELVELLDAVK